MVEAGRHLREEWREAFTMAFYVAISLLAALVAIDPEERLPTLGLIWGTTVGLAVTHLFAFRLAARLVAGGERTGEEGRLATAQLLGAAVVAAITSLPVLLVSSPTDVEVAQLVIAGFVGVSAFGVGRSSGAGVARSLVFASGVLVAGFAVAVLKNGLLGH